MICGAFLLCVLSFHPSKDNDLSFILKAGDSSLETRNDCRKRILQKGRGFSRFSDARFKDIILANLAARIEHDLFISKSLYLPISRKSFLTIALFLDKEGLQKRTN